MKYRNAAQAFVGRLSAAMDEGHEVDVRGFRTRELLHQHVVLEHPLERVISIPHRHNDIFAAVAETIWVLAGRNDLEYLSEYLPRAKDFSDDGVVWRAGYGPRLRSFRGTDQVAEVVNLLRRHPDSRRAVISIFDPATDFVPSRDVPCTNWLHAIVREGELDLAVTLRSNDLMWGFSGINTFEWSVLQEMLAFWIGVRVGHAHYFISSLHVYDYHWNRARRILAEQRGGDESSSGVRAARFSTSFDDFNATILQWFELEQLIRQGSADLDLVASFPDELLRDFLWVLAAKWAHLRGDLRDVDRSLSAIVDVALSSAVAAQLRALDEENDRSRQASSGEPTISIPSDFPGPSN